MLNHLLTLRRENRHLRKQVTCTQEMRKIEQLKHELMHSSCTCRSQPPTDPENTADGATDSDAAKALTAAVNDESSSKRFTFVGTMDTFSGPPFRGLYVERANPDRWLISREDDVEQAFHPNPTGWAQIAGILERQVPLPK